MLPAISTSHSPPQLLATPCLCLFVLFFQSYLAFHLLWQLRWNCWTCIVKANTVMGLLKALGLERRGLQGQWLWDWLCDQEGRGWWERESGESELGDEGLLRDRECPLVAFADCSAWARALLSARAERRTRRGAWYGPDKTQDNKTEHHSLAEARGSRASGKEE